jgi:hypothetical protein
MASNKIRKNSFAYVEEGRKRLSHSQYQFSAALEKLLLNIPHSQNGSDAFMNILCTFHVYWSKVSDNMNAAVNAHAIFL